MTVPGCRLFPLCRFVCSPVCPMNGYDGYVSLEMEDLTMSVEAGLETSIEALKATISR